MNILRKIYCRIFQIVFRIALPILPYRNPIILNKIEEIPALLKEKNKKHPMLVTDETLSKLGLMKHLEELLKEFSITYSIYDKTKQNPTTNMVEEALYIYQNSNCDCLIAFGGGSPIDCAKAIGARVARPKKELKKMAGIIKVRRKTPLFIAIPTTAGTGSETTLAAVIVDNKTRHKYVLNDFSLIPDYAILDAANIHTLPDDIVAATGMDALTHAIEAFIGRSTTKQTRADAIKATKLIFENIEKAMTHQDSVAEEKMLLASHLAGRAFTRSYVGYIHAVSHSLSGKYNMAHGLTNAILLPVVLEMYGSAVYKKLAKLSLELQLGNESENDEVLAKRLIDAIYRLNEKMGIPTKISGIVGEDIEEMAIYADKEANPLYPVPVLWDKNELKKIYRKVAQ